MRKIVLMFVAGTLVNCTHGGKNPDRDPAKTNAAPIFDATDPRLVDTGPNALTVWKALEMTKTAQGVAELDRLFDDEAINLSRLPQGYAAGTGTPLPDAPAGALNVLSWITGAAWRGKIFCASSDSYATHGYNRIKNLPFSKSTVVPMASFNTYMISPTDPRNLAHTAKSSLVILNYANPVTHGHLPYVVEGLLTVPHAGQVYDVMVPVRGKYGPIYLGKTWVGTYDANGEFHPDRESLIARYFLDFNPKALHVQRNNPNIFPKGQVEAPLTADFKCDGVTLPK